MTPEEEALREALITFEQMLDDDLEMAAQAAAAIIARFTIETAALETELRTTFR